MSEMPAARMSCVCCAAKFVIPQGQLLWRCPACGTEHESPAAAVTTQEQEAFTRAHELRQAREFVRAEQSYEALINLHGGDHRALWGFLLARYGVTFVIDPPTGEKRATVAFTRPKPMQQMPEFRRACELASPEVAEQYRRDALYVDRVQAQIRRRAEEYPAFDVFLCHKTACIDDPDTETAECGYARQLYDELTSAGYNVFFAPKNSLAPGAHYEAAIYHALSTSRVMLVTCADERNLASPWVRSEWLRFFDMMDNGEEKVLLPLLYDGFRPEQLPEEFQWHASQAQDMRSLKALSCIMQVLEERIGGREASPFRTVRGEKGLCITGCTGTDSTLIIPEVIGTEPVTEIGEDAFRRSAAVRTVILQEGVRRIGAGAFAGCSALEFISLPGTLEEIGARAFEQNTSLRRLVLPSGLQTIGENAFRHCVRLEDVRLPASLREIGRGAFSSCIGLTEVDVPAAVSSVGEGAFGGCGVTLKVRQDSAALRYALAEGQRREIIAEPVRPAPEPPRKEPVRPASPPQPESSELERLKAEAEMLLRMQQEASGAKAAPPARPAPAAAPVRDRAPAIPQPQEVQEQPRHEQQPPPRQEGQGSRITLSDTGAGRAKPIHHIDSSHRQVTATIQREGCTLRAVMKVTAGGLRVTSLMTEDAAPMRLPARIDGRPVVALERDAVNSILFWGTSLRLPEGLQAISPRAFSGLMGLRELHIPASVQEIGKGAFWKCRNLTLVVQPDTCAHAYAQQEKLPFRLEKAGVVSALAAEPDLNGDSEMAELMWAARRLEQLLNEAEDAPAPVPEASPEEHFEVREQATVCSICAYTGPGGDVVIPETIRGKRVEGVWSDAFRNARGVRSILLPRNLRIFGRGVFGMLPDVLLHVYRDSEAHTYVRSSGLRFKVID